MKVLFIQPPIRDFYRTKFREYPLGLLYLASAVEKNGHEPTILDLRICKKPKNVPTPDELAHLKQYYTRENNLYVNFKHFGMNYDDIAKTAAKSHPDAICISSMFTPYVNEVIETARAIKKTFPKTSIIAGGYHATADPTSLLETSYIDHIIPGEAEKSLPEFLSNGFIHKDEPQNKIISSLDTLPFPARHLIDPNNYLLGKKRYTMILTSRGCPYNCSFCSVHSVCGKTHRTRAIDSILDEIKECVERHKIEVFDFQDDNLLYNPERIKILLDKIASIYGQNKIELAASNGLNVSLLDKELTGLMKKTGFRKLDLALGTGKVPSRTMLHRPETTEQYERVLEIAGELRLPVTTYIILGLPTQPIAEMENTIAYLKNKQTLIAPSIFYNVPGMPMFETAKRYEYSHSHIARRSSAFNNFGEDYTRDDIFRLFRELRLSQLGKTFSV